MRRLLLCCIILSGLVIAGTSEAAAGARRKEAVKATHPAVGTSARSENGSVTITLIGQKHNFGAAEARDRDINSPKSVSIHPDGTKYYVNSLEGYATVVYDMQTHDKLKVIKHRFSAAQADLWAPQSEFYQFTHYPKNNVCGGKPVEAAFSHDGRYLWVPYYHRDYDINSQDPSAVAVIDTRTDEVVKLLETGPLPKMIATSHKDNQIAIAHWGDNTIGIIDASSQDPEQWHHASLYVVDEKLDLHYSTTSWVNRDHDSGNALRGTVFTPDDHYLLVSCMGEPGGIAVVDMQKRQMLGKVFGMAPNVRHMLIKDGWLYLSINIGGVVQRARLDSVISRIQLLGTQEEVCDSVRICKEVTVNNWETCEVGKGARTIVVSPDGRFIFAACNKDSMIAIVDTRTMKMVASILCDSYPVGLDISQDGHYLITTSQGRSGVGGNAVNIYEVTYAEEETQEVKLRD